MSNLKLWPKHVKELQRQWIGKELGVSFVCDVVNSSNELVDTVSVFSLDPEKVKHSTCVFAHIDSFLHGEEALYVKNPMSGKTMSVRVFDTKNFADSGKVFFETDQTKKVSHEDQYNVNSNKLQEFVDSNISKSCFVSTSRVHDWLISRQRFWGAPIPVVHCDDCGTIPVAEKDLPVSLPDRQPDKSALSDYQDWLETECPKCGKLAKRECDTMDTFVDSSWYFLRYLDSNNEKMIYNPIKESKFMPVDLYVGGIEHARMHLLYARFIMHVFYDLKLVSSKEPFSNLLCQGLMLSQSFKLEGSGQYVVPESVTAKDTSKDLIHTKTGQKVVTQYEKMSKSKYNGINPDDLVRKYGSDTVKCYVLDNINPTKEIFYNPRNLMGVIRWRNRLWILVTNFINHHSSAENTRYVQSKKETSVEHLWKQRNKAVLSYENMNCFEVADLRPDKTLRQTQALTNMLKTFDPSFYGNLIFQRSLLDLVIMVAPFMPLVCSELWSGLSDHVGLEVKSMKCYDFKKSVLEQKWPEKANGSELNIEINKNV